MHSSEEIVLNPIGYVKTSASGDQVKSKSLVSQIVIQDKFSGGLGGISSYSHVYVLFYLDQITDEQRKTLKVHPRGRLDLPLTGVFAVRTMLRPNPIGLTVVELVRVDDNVLTVRGLDAFDGTPVLDIKPMDPWDNREDLRVPEWWQKLNDEKHSELK